MGGNMARRLTDCGYKVTAVYDSYAPAAAELAKEIKATEGLIDRTRKRIEQIESELSDPALYDKNPGRAAGLAKQRSDLSNVLDRQENAWLELSSRYEEEMAQ